MRPSRIATPIPIAAALLTALSGVAAPAPCPEPTPPTEEATASVLDCAGDASPSVPGCAGDPDGRPGDELGERGRDLRGVYVPYPRLRAARPRGLVRWVRRIGADAVILDMKDDRGRVTFRDDLAGAEGGPHGEVERMGEIVGALRAAGIYVIGRVVCFKDNQLFRAEPGAALRDRRTGRVWRDRGGLAWSDPHSLAAHAHIARVAAAAAELGVDEVQLDYVRFPVEPSARFAHYPNRVGDPERHEVIAALLARVDDALDRPLSIDVFGLTAYNPGDPDGLGQSLEHLAPYIDAISPMLYLANWPARYYERPRPSRTHSLVEGAVARIRERLGDDIAVRPLLQGFRWRAKNYGVSFIHNQIDAAVGGGAAGYLFWNQNGVYGTVAAAFADLDRLARPSLPVLSER